MTILNTPMAWPLAKNAAKGARSESTKSSSQSGNIEFTCVGSEEMNSAEWTTLFVSSNTQNHFYSETFVSAALHAWANLKDVKFVVGRQQDQLIFLLPVQIVKQWRCTTVKVVNIPTSDQNEPLINCSNQRDVLSIFFDYLQNELCADRIIAESLTASFAESLCTRFPSKTTRKKNEHSGWLISIPENADNIFDIYSANFRQQMRRHDRKALAAGLKFRVTRSQDLEDHQTLKANMDTLRRLHKLRRDALGKSTFFLDPSFVKMHDSIIEKSKAGSLDVLFLEVMDGTDVVGSLYGVIGNHKFTFLMCGFNPNYAAFSLGHCMILHTIQALVQIGACEFDLKTGSESYKARWGEQQYDKSDVTVTMTLKGQFLRLVDLLGRLGR